MPDRALRAYLEVAALSVEQARVYFRQNTLSCKRRAEQLILGGTGVRAGEHSSRGGRVNTSAANFGPTVRETKPGSSSSGCRCSWHSRQTAL